MKVLATAHPNEGYRWYSSISSIRLEARISRKGKILFFSVDSKLNTENRHRQEIIESMFPTDVIRRKRPFLIKGNEDFYAILMRHRKKYENIANKLIKSIDYERENSKQTRRKKRSKAAPSKRRRTKRK